MCVSYECVSYGRDIFFNDNVFTRKTACILHETRFQVNMLQLLLHSYLWIASYFVIYVILLFTFINILYNADYLFTFIIIQFSDILQPVDVLVREDPFSLTCIRLFTDLTNNCLC